ncbi:MAG TPA: 50S ribosomal protein L13 [Candidatus Eisenbacteria bacterium]|nr:50S ribosomal protein L13 [Candidatus Eisenbacteria bacterium]
MKQKTYTARPADLKPRWLLVDAQGQTLGRLAANVARLLRGKHKPDFTPHLNTGDHVIVVNASGLRVTGKKVETKIYTRYTGYPGGLRKTAYGDLARRYPTAPFRHAVRGMLQHGTLGTEQLKRLKIYAGAAHPHQSQQPVPIAFGAKGEIKELGG